jgi:hypothetical protein
MWTGHGRGLSPCACAAYEDSGRTHGSRPRPDVALDEPALRRRRTQRDEQTRREKIKQQRLAALRQWLGLKEEDGPEKIRP